MKVRIKFAKRGSMKFVGHLDIMRYFQKAIRRANIDVAYSEGFSPHQLLSFANPLGVGLESEGELFDMTLASQQDVTWIKDALNAQMNPEMEIIDVWALPEDAKKSMSLVCAADYRIIFRNGYEPGEKLSTKLSTFLEQDEILVMKKTKSSEKEVDIKPMIFTMYLEEDNSIYLKVAAGSVENLKPSTVMEAFCNYIGQPYTPFTCMFTRLNLYLSDDTVQEEN